MSVIEISNTKGGDGRFHLEHCSKFVWRFSGNALENNDELVGEVADDICPF